jgi:hypothetical protein
MKEQLGVKTKLMVEAILVHLAQRVAKPTLNVMLK